MINEGDYEEAALQFEKSGRIPRTTDYNVLIHAIRYYNDGDYYTAHSNFVWVGTSFLDPTAASAIQAMDDKCCEIIDERYIEKQKELAEESKAKTNTKTSTKMATTQHTIPYDFYDVYYYDDPYEFYYDHVNDFYDLEDAEDYFYEHEEYASCCHVIVNSDIKDQPPRWNS